LSEYEGVDDAQFSSSGGTERPVRRPPSNRWFGGYKQSGIGRECHKMMLEHYQQTKNMLVSYSPKKPGFF
jgi:hypothetical protein